MTRRPGPIDGAHRRATAGSSCIDIDQHAKATHAYLERGENSFLLWFTGPPRWSRRPQHICRRDIGDSVTDWQSVAHIERQMIAAGYRVERLPTNSGVIAAWQITLDV